MSDGKVLGIIGGMGAKAGVDFYNRLVELTPAATDKDHIKTILYSNTGIPDRTQAIVGRGKDPLPELRLSAKLLEDNGAEVIVLACVSAHYYIEELRDSVSCQIPSAVEETVKTLSENHPHLNDIGIMGTTGTIRSGLFQNELEEAGFTPLVLSDELQDELVMGAIYGMEGIKAGNMGDSRGRVLEASREIVGLGAEAIILGCSELPLVINQSDVDLPILDSMEILIKKAISLCTM